MGIIVLIIFYLMIFNYHFYKICYVLQRNVSSNQPYSNILILIKTYLQYFSLYYIMLHLKLAFMASIFRPIWILDLLGRVFNSPWLLSVSLFDCLCKSLRQLISFFKISTLVYLKGYHVITHIHWCFCPFICLSISQRQSINFL